uniref:Uncharacterized protein n=1 Tax=Alexandrium andersonii TaxID=327968 RepID=A0A7S2BW66_9DINO
MEEQHEGVRLLRERRSSQEAKAQAEEAEVARLQAHIDNLQKEIVAADFRRDRAEADSAAKRKVHRWASLCAMSLIQEHEKAFCKEVEDFEAAVRESEILAGPAAPVSPRPGGFYAQLASAAA